VDLVDEHLNGRSAVVGDARPFLRGELRALDQTITAVMTNVSDRATRLHLEDVQHRIGESLDPSATHAERDTADGLSRQDWAATHGLIEWWGGVLFGDHQPCWVDYAIRRQ